MDIWIGKENTDAEKDYWYFSDIMRCCVYNTEEEVDAFLKILPDAIAAAQAETERLNNQEMVARLVEPSY